MKKNKIIIISGPTATGKTEISINLSEYLKEKSISSVIVNFDSLLFYNELNIGTAKPSRNERALVKHEMIDIFSAKFHLNASGYCKMAMPIIDNYHNNGFVVILTGGSNFYLRAILKGMYESSETTEAIKESIKEVISQKGFSEINKILKENDPESLVNIHNNDHYRLVRAVEYFMETGKKISDQKKSFDHVEAFNFNISPINPSWDILHASIDINKPDHQKIILSRTTKMIEQGLINEVEDLLNNGFTGKEKPLCSIGYKESVQFINNEINSIDDCIERISISTRQLAKSQRTWLKKIENKIELTDPASINTFFSQTSQFVLS